MITNIPKAFNSANEFSLKSVEINDRNGTSTDITSIVVSLRVSASLFAPSMIFEIAIRDNNDVFNQLDLNGEEQINIKIENNDEKEIELSGWITEFPEYSRDEKITETVIRIVAVEDHLFFGKQIQVSRFVEGSTVDIIDNLLKRDLGYPFEVSENSSSFFSGVLPYRNIFAHIEWLRQRTFNENMVPFYFFSAIDRDEGRQKLFFESQSTMIGRGVYKDYTLADGDSEFEQYSEEDIKYRRRLILSINSELKMNRLVQGVRGAWISKNKSFDSFTKSIRSKDFRYKESQGQVGSTAPVIIRPEFFEGINPHQYFNRRTAFSQSNGLDNRYQYSEITDKARAKLKAASEILNGTSHSIRLYGDINLTPGMMIELNIPKVNFADEEDDALDERMSGRYIVSSSVHIFEGGYHFTELRVIRDSNG